MFAIRRWREVERYGGISGVTPHETLVKYTFRGVSPRTFVDGEEAKATPLGGEVVGRVTVKCAANGTVGTAGEFVTGYDEKKQKYTTVKATGSATLVPVNEDDFIVIVYLTPKGLAPHTRSLEVSAQ